MSDVLSKRALKYIAFTIGEFVSKGEIVTNNDIDMDTYNKALKSVRKMVKKLPEKPEKYIDMDYLSQDMIDQLESEALTWEQEKGIYR